MLSHYYYGELGEYSTSIPRSEIVDEGHQIHAGHWFGALLESLLGFYSSWRPYVFLCLLPLHVPCRQIWWDSFATSSDKWVFSLLVWHQQIVWQLTYATYFLFLIVGGWIIFGLAFSQVFIWGCHTVCMERSFTLPQVIWLFHSPRLQIYFALSKLLIPTLPLQKIIRSTQQSDEWGPKDDDTRNRWESFTEMKKP